MYPMKALHTYLGDMSHEQGIDTVYLYGAMVYLVIVKGVCCGLCWNKWLLMIVTVMKYLLGMKALHAYSLTTP